MPSDEFNAELEMLRSMYPDELSWSEKNSELVYTDAGDGRASSLTLRVPDEYPGSALPEVVVATFQRQDGRDAMQRGIKRCELGVPVIDIIIDEYRSLVDKTVAQDQSDQMQEDGAANTGQERKLTVVIWLHHLLNTSKRKQVTSPELEGVSGVSKPGYPGVLIFSGPDFAVCKHVEELKALRWQGFQVRMEVAEEWTFLHGAAVLEVESMAAVVAAVGEDKKQQLLEAVMRQ